MNRAAFLIVGIFALTFFSLAVSSAAFADGDPVAGQKYFQGYCRECHYLRKTQGEPLGPNLSGFYARQTAASDPDYAYMYTLALKLAHLTWDDATLDKWLTNPNALVPGTKMRGFAGIPDAQTRANVIAYLKTIN